MTLQAGFYPKVLAGQLLPALGDEVRVTSEKFSGGLFFSKENEGSVSVGTSVQAEVREQKHFSSK